MGLNLYLVTALVISVLLNVILCIQLGKFRTSRISKWKEGMGINTPFAALVWAFLAITIVLSLIGLLAGVSDL
ncbi:hypothetical protein [Bacillus subtilis]|uniref:hypothetical protein n=1 Tax=Bacillus subtilis TaxID=1423 RepID=UPI0021F7B4B4|nr:hypothetical protein [Bacillus subtilis]